MGASADSNIVATQIDPYLRKTLTLKSYDRNSGKMADTIRPVIVDDGRLEGNDPLMKSSQSRTALLINEVNGNNSSELYWYDYGRLVNGKFQSGEPMGIRCDTCTALAFYLLRQNGCSGSITVIEQDKGNANGHWFLVVGCPEAVDIAYPDKFPRGSFIIDLWGVGVKEQRGEHHAATSVINPPACVYSCQANKLTKKIYFPGINTLPTKEEFVGETTVPGCVGEKTRSGKLKTLDQALDDFHKRKIDIGAVNTALQAWIGAKSKRQVDEIDSIRNKDGAMDRLRTQVQWLTGWAS